MAFTRVPYTLSIFFPLCVLMSWVSILLDNTLEVYVRVLEALD